MLILVCISTCVVFGQYTEGNTIVTLSKYYLKPWRTVENGDWKEREKLFDEHRKKWYLEIICLSALTFFTITCLGIRVKS